MKVGFVGCGKLGIPVMVAMDYRGHDVMGYDVDPTRMQKETFPHLEQWPLPSADTFELALRQSDVRFGPLDEVVRHAEILFVAVQTPHDPLYEGITRLPKTRVDFDYRYLKDSIAQINAIVEAQKTPKVVVIISTVLPGTMREQVLPLCGPLMKICYNPYFIAMGTVVSDFLHPEFVLFGKYDDDAERLAKRFYRSCTSAPVYVTSIENAELIKVAYNTFISTKIVFANTLMEICDKLPGLDVDQVVDGLCLGTRRLLSPMYLRGGMGDGGGCHPRDNIALSHVAEQYEMSFDLFGAIMTARERQTEYLANLAKSFAKERKLPIMLVGKAFKPGTNLTTGSPALLLKSILDETVKSVKAWDPLIDGLTSIQKPHVFVISTKHPEFSHYRWPVGSVVIDPHRYIPEQDGVEVYAVGRH